MSDGTPTGTPETSTDPPKGETGKTFTQEQVNDLLARQKGDVQRKYSDYDDLKTKAAELDQIREANASEIEKAQNKATKAERDEAKAALLRYEVANEKKVPAEAMDLLVGSTREELEAKADKLLELVKPGEQPPPEFDGGPREPAPPAKTPEQAHNELAAALFGAPQTN